MEKLLDYLRITMEEPPAFGTFHLTAIACVLALTLLLCLFFRNANGAVYRIIVLTIWLIMISMEVLKQLQIGFDVQPDGSLTWDYRWHAFPFQLCDTPLYVLPLIVILKDGKIRDALSAYMCTYVLLGGAITYALPVTILGTNLYVNIQTLTHHGLQMVAAVYIAVYNRKRFSWRYFLSGVIVFCVLVGIAALCNVVFHKKYPEESINLFYISPYDRKVIPIWNDIWQRQHWAMAMAIYVVGFTGLACIVFVIYRVIFYLSAHLAERFRAHRKKEQD